MLCGVVTKKATEVLPGNAELIKMKDLQQKEKKSIPFLKVT